MGMSYNNDDQCGRQTPEILLSWKSIGKNVIKIFRLYYFEILKVYSVNFKKWEYLKIK